MNKEYLDLIKITADYIEDRQNVSKKLNLLIDPTEDPDEAKVLFDFSWLYDKFKNLWFPQKNIEAYITENLPGVTPFTPKDFEMLIQSALYLIEDKIYQETPITNDGGIDLFYEEIIHESSFDLCMTFKTVIQCKLYSGYVPVTELRDFFGVMSAHTATGIFITTGKFTSQAKEFIPLANSSPHSNRLFCIDGTDCKNLLNIANEIYTLISGKMKSDEDNEEDKQDFIAHRIIKLQEDGKNIINSKKFTAAIQNSLF